MTDSQDEHGKPRREHGNSQRERAKQTTEQVQAAHPAEATGDIDPQGDDLVQTPHGLRHTGRPNKESDPRHEGPGDRQG